MQRRTAINLVKLLIACLALFCFFYWLASLWSNWDYYVNIMWYGLLYGRRWRLYGWAMLDH